MNQGYDLTDLKRVVLIVTALQECEGVTLVRVAKQFKYETGRGLPEGVMKVAIKKVAKKLKGPVLPSSKVTVVQNEEYKGRKVLEKDARGPLVVAAPKKERKAGEEESLPAPMWSDCHGLTDSGIDGIVMIGADIQAQIKELKRQLDEEVKPELLRLMDEAKVERVMFDGGVKLEAYHPQEYLGTPKREKLVMLGVPEKTINAACDPVKPKPFVKIVLPKGE